MSHRVDFVPDVDNQVPGLCDEMFAELPLELSGSLRDNGPTLSGA